MWVRAFSIRKSRNSEFSAFLIFPTGAQARNLEIQNFQISFFGMGDLMENDSSSLPLLASWWSTRGNQLSLSPDKRLITLTPQFEKEGVVTVSKINNDRKDKVLL